MLNDKKKNDKIERLVYNLKKIKLRSIISKTI